MRLKGVVMEDFINYKKPSMFLITSVCDWKCCKENNLDVSVCQNNPLATQPMHNISSETLYEAYKNNPITKAIVFGGLEPMLQFDELLEVIKYFRVCCNDDIVIYTGYYPNEIQDKIDTLKQYKNIIIKFGRYIPNKEEVYDEILGIKLVSNNQYAERIS